MEPVDTDQALGNNVCGIVDVFFFQVIPLLVISEIYSKIHEGYTHLEHFKRMK